MFPPDEVFFNYLENIFFTNPDKKYTSEELLESFTWSYKHESYIHVGIARLLQIGSIEQLNEDAKDYYRALKSGIDKRRKEEKYKEEMLELIVQSNKATTKLSKNQVTTNGISILLALVSTTFIIITGVNQCNDRTDEELQLIRGVLE